MSTPQKPQGGTKSELSKLKLLAPEQREAIWEWRAEKDDVGATISNATIRHRIATQFGIRLSGDWQLSRFWSWQWHQMRAESWNERQEQFQKFYQEQNPNASRDQVRQAAIAFFMTEAAADGDRDGFVEIANLDLAEQTGKSKAHFKEREVTLAEQKAADVKKSEGQKALEYCLQDARQFPAVVELFKKAFAELDRAKSGAYS